MAGSNLSPTLQALIEKGLFARLPGTFSTFFFEQMQDWDTLFPAERNYHERLFRLLDRSDGALVERLFEPLRRIERPRGVKLMRAEPDHTAEQHHR